MTFKLGQQIWICGVLQDNGTVIPDPEGILIRLRNISGNVTVSLCNGYVVEVPEEWCDSLQHDDIHD